MFQKDLINREKGSVSVYAITTVFCFMIILGAIFYSSSAVRKNQLKALIKMKEIYAQPISQVATIAEKRKAQEKVEVNYAYTGSLQTFTVPKTGKYQIEAAGASGAGGNKYGQTLTAEGGKGAKIIATFNLTKGDTIDMVVGGEGTCTQATSADGTSGRRRWRNICV